MAVSPLDKKQQFLNELVILCGKHDVVVEYDEGEPAFSARWNDSEHWAISAWYLTMKEIDKAFGYRPIPLPILQNMTVEARNAFAHEYNNVDVKRLMNPTLEFDFSKEHSIIRDLPEPIPEHDYIKVTGPAAQSSLSWEDEIAGDMPQPPFLNFPHLPRSECGMLVGEATVPAMLKCGVLSESDWPLPLVPSDFDGPATPGGITRESVAEAIRITEKLPVFPHLITAEEYEAFKATVGPEQRRIRLRNGMSEVPDISVASALAPYHSDYKSNQPQIDIAELDYARENSSLVKFFELQAEVAREQEEVSEPDIYKTWVDATIQKPEKEFLAEYQNVWQDSSNALFSADQIRGITSNIPPELMSEDPYIPVDIMDQVVSGFTETVAGTPAKFPQELLDDDQHFPLDILNRLESSFTETFVDKWRNDDKKLDEFIESVRIA